MKVISVVNLKGGVGKTTIGSITINSLTIDYGYKCLLVEADKQGTLSDVRALEKRKDPEGIFPYDIVRVSPESVFEYLKQKSEQVEGYDIVFIELPGFFDEDIEKALEICDGILIPVVVNLADKLSLFRFKKQVQKIIEKKQESGHEFIYYAVRNKRVLNSAEEKVFGAFLSEVVQMDTFEASFRNLVAYTKLTTQKSYISDKDYKSVSDEVKAYVEEFIEKFEIPVKKKVKVKS